MKTPEELAEWDRKHNDLRASLPDGWFDAYTDTVNRSWDELLRECPFHVLRLKPESERFDLYTIHELEYARWMLNHTENMMDFSFVLETSEFLEVRFVAHMRNEYMISRPVVAGIIIADEGTAALFKLTFSDLLYIS